MKSKAYWLKRALQRQSAIDKLSQAELNEIRKIYDSAQRDLTKMINEIYSTYSKKAGIDVSELKRLLSYSETDKFWKSLEGQNMQQYIMENYKSRISRLEQYQAKLQARCNELAEKQEKAMSIGGRNAIRSSYSKTVYDTSIGVNADLSFATLDDRTINRILKEKWIGSNYSDRVWKNADLLAGNIKDILTRTVMTGASQSRAIMELRDRMGVEWYKAERLVRTEMNHFHNQAEKEAYEDMGVEKYVYVATLDNRTSEICQELDGKIFKLSEAEEGVNYPPMHPFCRSTVRAYISEEVEKSMKRRARDEEGNNEVIENMSYKEWMNSKSDLNDGGDPKDSSEAVSSFVPAIAIEEAEKYAENFVDTGKFAYQGVSYKYISVESANEVNKALDSFYNRFDVEKLSRIKSIKKGTREHRLSFKGNAPMSYNRASDWLNLNTEMCKTPKLFSDSVKESNSVVESFIKNPELFYNEFKDRPDIIKRLDDTVLSGRDMVPETIEEAVYHELGHGLEKYIVKHADYNEIVSNMDIFQRQISGYACYNEHEYFAESFASYMKGENLIDPKLKEVFESLKK